MDEAERGFHPRLDELETNLWILGDILVAPRCDILVAPRCLKNAARGMSIHFEVYSCIKPREPVQNEMVHYQRTVL